MPIPHAALALFLMLLWGYNFVVIKVSIAEVPPLLLACSRFFLTSIPAIFFIKRPATEWKMLLGYGLAMLAMPFSLSFMGIKMGVTPGLAALTLQLQAFFTLLFAWLILKERLRTWHILGAAVAFSGMVLVAMNTTGSGSIVGFLTIITGAISWGIGNIIAKKIGKVNMLSLVVWGSFVAWPPLLALSLLTEGADQVLYSLQNLSWLATGSILYIAFPCTLIGFAIWSWLMHHYPLSIVAPFSLLVPVIAMFSSALILNEPLEPWKLLAASLVITGLCLNLWGERLFRKRITF